MEINGWVVLFGGIVLFIVIGAIIRERYFDSEREPTNTELILEMGRMRTELADTKRELEETKATVASLLRSLSEKDAKIDKLTAEVNELKRNQAATPLAPTPKQSSRQPILHVVADSAVNSELDLAKLRQVRERTGMEFTRVRTPTREKLYRQITAAAARGDPWRRIHFAAHSDKNGIEIGKELITAPWLSEIIPSADVVMLASCEGDAVANYLGVAKAVVVLIETATDDQAARFSGAFWMEIGAGKNAQDAYDEACDRCPDVAEFAEIYIN